MAKNCIFCDIANGKINAYKVYEEKNYLAFLDIFPNIKGQTLVIPKRHMGSNIFDLNDKELVEFIKATKRVAKLLENKLGVGRVHLVFEGTGVNHLHAKLYPAIGLKSKEFKEIWAKEKAYFKRYEGYVTTLTGPRASDASLRRVMGQIREG
jgi:diadenosine tetraphosphate (Ap4A) HIT family hydrolase